MKSRPRKTRPPLLGIAGILLLAAGALALILPGGAPRTHTAREQLAAGTVPNLLDPAQAGVAGPGNCVLIAPADPLSAKGLATPYQLTGPQGASPQASGCTMADAGNVGAFVQATIVTPGGELFVYDPLVITAGTTPAKLPVTPQIPAGSTVGIWTGYNGNLLTIAGAGAGAFIQGLPGSGFGQVAAANAAAFFAAAKASGAAAHASLGTSKLDGRPCPTTRDFGVVDQDPSDNVTTRYVLTAGGQTAQQGSGVTGQLIANGSDNRLLDAFIDPALGCTPFTAQDLSDNDAQTPAQALNELQAMNQAAPVALVPPNDPMTQVNGQLNLLKTNLYRANVGQPPLQTSPAQAAAAYCRNLQQTAPARLAMDANQFQAAQSPTTGMNLAQFLQARYQAAVQLLNCAQFAG
jgi:hypothetical protein